MNICIREREYLDKYKCIDHYRNTILTNYWISGSLLYYKHGYQTGSISFDDIEQISVGNTVIKFTQYPEKYRDELVRNAIELLSKYDTKGSEK